MAEIWRHGWRRRLWPLLGAAGLVIALIAPLWQTRMEAPQYHGDEVLVVDVYAGRMEGDLAEIQILNSYIGVRLPVDIPELRASRWVLLGLLVIAIAWNLVPSSGARLTAGLLCAALVIAALAAGIALQRRLYEIGHDRGPSVFARVDDFTPPLFGSRKIENFTVSTMPHVGAWTYLGVAVMAGWVAVRSPNRPEENDE